MGIIDERLEHANAATIFTETPPFPKTLMLEPSTACNLRCVFCSTLRSKRKARFVDPALARTVMEDAFIAGAREIGLYLGGESLLNPDFEKLVRAASGIGYEYIYLTTNGVLATKERVASLIECGLHSIKFSINATEPETYAAVHGSAQFEKVMKNFYDAAVLRDESIASGKAFYRLLASNVYTGEMTDDLVSFQEHLAGIADDVVLSRAATMNGDIRQCFMPFNRLHVTAEGYATFCCQDFDTMLVYADLNKETVAGAWNGPAAVAFRRRFLAGDLAGTQCGRCLHGSREPVLPLR